VLVVEHDPDVINVADHIVDVGPHAGRNGGSIVYQGSLAGLLDADTLTARHLKQALPIKQSFRAPNSKLSITNAKINNLRNVCVDIPTGVLTVVTGVAGSGKSSLINQLQDGWCCGEHGWRALRWPGYTNIPPQQSRPA